MASILVISKYYHPFSGGIEENVRQIAEYAAGKHKVTVVASNHEPGNKTDEIGGVQIIRKNVQFLYKSQPITIGFLSGLKLADYDVIHFHSPNPLVTLQFLSKRLLEGNEVPVVVTHHMDIYGRKLLRAISMPSIRHMIRNASYTIVTSKKNAEISRDLPEDGRYVAIPLAISRHDYTITNKIRDEAAVWRKKLSGDAPLVGFVGRHARYKGLSVLIGALARMPGVHAVLAGDGPYKADAEARAKALGITDRVHFLGRIDHNEKLRLMAAIDVFAFPSTETTEAFGISQMEAMLCGAPVVASDLPTGVTDVAINDKTALLSPPGDAAILAQSLSQVIADPKLAARLAETARRHVLDNMTHEIVCGRTVSVLEAAAAGTPLPTDW